MIVCFPATSCAPKYIFRRNIGINSPFSCAINYLFSISSPQDGTSSCHLVISPHNDGGNKTASHPITSMLGGLTTDDDGRYSIALLPPPHSCPVALTTTMALSIVSPSTLGGCTNNDDGCCSIASLPPPPTLSPSSPPTVARPSTAIPVGRTACRPVLLSPVIVCCR